MFIHVVLFWCKPGTPDGVKKEMIRYAHETMPKIPSVKGVWSGTSVPSPRDAVDSSYDVGLCVAFADKTDQELYQAHELHSEFVHRFKDHWDKLRVFDFE